MPELPEVETIRRNVVAYLVGKRCVEADVRLAKLVRLSPITDLTVMVGQTVLSAGRRAKVLTIELSGGLTLLVHFKLAGQLAIVPAGGMPVVAGHPYPDPTGTFPQSATHAIFSFDDGTMAYYSDLRQFGWLRLLPTVDVERALNAFQFGPEATSGGFTAEYLGERLGRRTIPVKTALLDQTILAGLGNIYVDEALFAAGIDPRQLANSLTPKQTERLSAAIPIALEEGIRQGGAKIIHRRAYPVNGFPAVHGRTGEPCNTCRNLIVKTRVGARGTYLCETCQRLPVCP